MSAATKQISRIERLNSSVNGNPRYRIGFDDASTAITSSDHAFCYTVGNPEMREGSAVSVEYTRAGRISHMDPVS
jgi:hypothetical protein